MCLSPDCQSVTRARGYCLPHYHVARRAGIIDVLPRPADRFWSKVNKTDGCWLWTAAISSVGYGVYRIETNRNVLAHRFAYEQAKGPIPAGLELDHLCRTPLCVRPEHLEAVTHSENVRRGTAHDKAHAMTHCKRGHEFTEANIYRGNGSRQCKACSNLMHMLRKRQRRAASSTSPR